MPGTTAKHGPGGRRSRIVLVLGYALTGIAWITFSDQAVRAIFPADVLPVVETAKGVFFVVATGSLLWLFVLARDIRLDRRRAELADSEERYRMLAERSQDVVYRLRVVPEPAFDYVSPSIRAFTGHTPQEHYADPALGRALIDPDDLPLLQRAATGQADGPVMLRWRRADGQACWAEHQVTPIRDTDGRLIALEGAARDVTARVLADADRHLLMRAIDGTPVGVALIGGPAGGFAVTYANPALSDLLGIDRDQLLGRSAFEFGTLGDPVRTDEVLGRVVAGEPFELPSQVARTGADPVPVSILVSPLTGPDGEVEGILTFMQDRTEAQARSRAESHLRAALDASPLAIVAMDGEGRVTTWNPAAEQLFGWTAAEAIGRQVPYLDEDGWAGSEARRLQLIQGTAEPYVVRSFKRSDNTSVMCHLTTGVIRDREGRPTGFLSLINDLTESLRREEWNNQLRRAIDHAAEAVVITDLSGAITYVNPAFESVSGYSLSELLGRNPRVLKSGLTSPAVYDDIWRRLNAGETWRGILVNKRKDGSLFEEEATLSAVLGPDGVPTAYVGVKRDLTLERRLAAGLSTELLDRAAVEEAMARIEVRETAEATAQDVCDALATFGDLDDIEIFALPPGRSLVVPIACVASSMPIHLGEPVEAGVAAYIRERASGGPWADIHATGRIDPRMDHAALTGVVSVSAPIRYRGRTVGVLVALSRTTSPDTWIARHLRIVSELATHAGPLLGPQLGSHDLGTAGIDELRRIIDEVAFAPVFQPVCDLATRKPVGWEAFTRFTDGTAPLQRFTDAKAMGLGEALELACGARAIAAFAELGHAGWISVNVSPGIVMSGGVPRMLGRTGGTVVLELTEQVPIDDYARLRGAVDLLEPPALLAVDDTGAGYASLRHVLELRPDFVKLEPAFVHDIDRDETRQAKVAGMVHYAAENDSELIAEGIETEAERRTLVRLGVRLGQGYLLGVPSATGAVSAPRTGTGARRLRAVADQDDSSSVAG